MAARELIIMEVDLEGTRVISTVQRGFLQFPSSLTIANKMISNKELLALSSMDQVQDNSLGASHAGISSDVFNLSAGDEWEIYLSELMREAKVHTSTPPQLYIIVPSWLEIDSSESLERLFLDIKLASICMLRRNFAIAQAYSPGIPPQLSSHIVVVEINAGTVILSPACRKGDEWHVGKVFSRNYDAAVIDEEIFRWIFSFLEEFSEGHEMVVLVDSSEKLYELLEVKCRLLGKSARIVLVDFQIVMERTLERCQSYVIAQSFMQEQDDEYSMSRNNPESSGLLAAVSQQSVLAGELPRYPISRLIGNKSLVLLLGAMLLTVMVVIIWCVLPYNTNHVPSSEVAGNIDSFSKPMISAPGSNPSRIMHAGQIDFTLPAGWESKTDSSMGNIVHSARENTYFLLHPDRSWEIMELKFIPHHLELGHLRMKVSAARNLDHFREMPIIGNWHQYRYEEFPSDETTTNTMVQWTILADTSSVVQIGCVYLKHSVVYPACQEVIESVHVR